MANAKYIPAKVMIERINAVGRDVNVRIGAPATATEKALWDYALTVGGKVTDRFNDLRIIEGVATTLNVIKENERIAAE